MGRAVRVIGLGLVLATGTAFGAAPAGKTGVVKGTLRVDGKPAADAVVSIEGLPESSKSGRADGSARKAVVDQREMKFIPRVLAIPVGTTVDFPNDDKEWHSVYSRSEPNKFDLGLYAPKESRSTTFDKPGVVRILCNVHPAMEAFIVVEDDPLFTVVGRDGGYELDGVPLGKFELEVWHPDLGTKRIPIELVREGEVLNRDIELKR